MCVWMCVCVWGADQMWSMWVKAFSLMHPWCLCVKRKKERTNLEWGCCLCCHSAWCPAQPGRHIGPGNENVFSHWGEEGSELVNLSGRSDTSSQCWQSVWCHTYRLCPSPSCNFFLSSSPPPMSRWIFSHSLTLKTLLTATVTVSKWGKCVRCVRDVIFRAPGSARQPVWTDNKKE